MTLEAKPRSSKLTWILVGIIVVLAVGLIGVLLYLKNQPQPKRGMVADPANRAQRSELGGLGRQLSE